VLRTITLLIAVIAALPLNAAEPVISRADEDFLREQALVMGAYIKGNVCATRDVRQFRKFVTRARRKWRRLEGARQNCDG